MSDRVGSVATVAAALLVPVVLFGVRSETGLPLTVTETWIAVVGTIAAGLILGAGIAFVRRRTDRLWLMFPLWVVVQTLLTLNTYHVDGWAHASISVSLIGAGMFASYGLLGKTANSASPPQTG